VRIVGFKKFSLIDYPGLSSCTVFIAGCNLNCPWCNESEAVLVNKFQKNFGFLQKKLFKFLKEKKKILDGVCLSGGEPTLNEQLPKFCKKIKKLGYKVKLDTNGSNPKMLADLIGKNLIDYVALDVKAPPEKYPQVVGLEKVSLFFLLKKINESIELLKEGKIDYEFRTTLVPGLLKKEDILKIARWISPARKYVLQNFRPEKTLDPNFQNLQPYPSEYLFRIQKAISPFFEICEVRK